MCYSSNGGCYYPIVPEHSDRETIFFKLFFANYIYPIPNVETALSVEKSPNKLFCGTDMHCTVQFSLHKANRRRADLILWEEDSAGSEVFDFG